ncbi:MAG: hypothetical protein HY806_09555 [Nitrospirae bacterium]|nr:hypothetical protein [Nitrospirota bacterium]
MESVTCEPFKFAVVEPLYITVPDELSASTRKVLLLPFGTSKDFDMLDSPDTDIVSVIVDMSEAEIVNLMLATVEGIADEVRSPLAEDALLELPTFTVTFELPEEPEPEPEPAPPPPPQLLNVIASRIIANMAVNLFTKNLLYSYGKFTLIFTGVVVAG